MPQLLVFAPCEKVIISQDENNPTLIAVLTELGAQFQTDSNVELPANFLVPMRWTIFVMWRRLPEDKSKTFEQVIEIRSPSGKDAGMNQPIDIVSSDKLTHRIMAQMPGIPTSEAGEWSLRLFLYEKGMKRPTEPVAVYPLLIHVVRLSPEQKSES